MPNQTTTQHTAYVFGSALIQIGATAGAATTNVGLARDVQVAEQIGKVWAQADDSVNPLGRSSRHTVAVSFTLLEFWPPYFDELRGQNFDTENEATAGTYVAGTANVISTGGNTKLSPLAIKLTNNTLQSGATTQTVMVVYSATVEEGLNLAMRSDNTADPILPLPFSFTGRLDNDRTSGDRLYIIESELGA